MAVRSRRVALGRIVTANVATTVYTVPADRTLVVRTIQLENQSVTTGQVYVRVTNSDTGTTLRIYDELNFAPRQRVVLDAWCVLEEGDSIAILAAMANGLNYWISGALLMGDSE